MMRSRVSCATGWMSLANPGRAGALPEASAGASVALVSAVTSRLAISSPICLVAPDAGRAGGQAATLPPPAPAVRVRLACYGARVQPVFVWTLFPQSLCLALAVVVVLL